MYSVHFENTFCADRGFKERVILFRRTSRVATILQPDVEGSQCDNESRDEPHQILNWLDTKPGKFVGKIICFCIIENANPVKLFLFEMIHYKFLRTQRYFDSKNYVIKRDLFLKLTRKPLNMTLYSCYDCRTMSHVIN